jgi:transcriptional regulator with PAS, ATPase and Fis domain
MNSTIAPGQCERETRVRVWPATNSPAEPLCRQTRTLLESIQDLDSLLADSSLVQTDGRDTVAKSQRMRELMTHARRVAATRATVLIEGESGTGKELLARLIHFTSPRATGPFVSVNCAALSESLIESELFGHERGAFTGATESRHGRFEAAGGGTLLLDEISEMPLKLQAKLLRVLEEGQLERVGGTRTLQVDVRVVATSNRNLEDEVGRGNFRRDLYYRLNVTRLRIPPLRERRDDIPPLVAYFLWKFRNEAQTPLRGVAAKTLEILCSYAWPGNVRQLRNVMQHACIHTSDDEIQPSDLPPLESWDGAADSDRSGTLEEIERKVILRTLQELDGNKTAAAAKLGVTPRTLLNKVTKYRQQGLL